MLSTPGSRKRKKNARTPKASRKIPQRRARGNVYQSSAQACTLRRAPSKRPHLGWGEWLGNLRRPKNRRSKARLGRHRRAAPNVKAAVLAPARSLARINGRAVFNVLFLALIGWGLIWFFTDDCFYVQTVQISGNQRVSTEAILSACGIKGYSIFWINARQVAGNISAALPPVKNVRVRYGLPNTVHLVVEEQGGQVMWQLGGKRYWVDDDGQLHLAPEDSTPGILVQDIRPGRPDRVDPEAVLAAQQLLALLPEVKTLEYAPLTGLRLRHPKGWIVYLGAGDDMARKISLLKAIEREFAGEETPQPALVDLRFPDSPYYRLPNQDGA